MATLFSKLKKRKKENKRIILDDTIIKIQEGDTQLHNAILEQYTPFVASTVSSVCNRYIQETDDEFSIGLIAFNEAIEKFSPSKHTSIITFAETVIKNRVIDYTRKESRHMNDSIPLYNDNYDNENIFGNEYAQTKIEADISIEEFQRQEERRKIQEEIAHFQNTLKEFGLSFDDLVKQSPKHVDARINAIQVAKVLVESDDLKSALWNSKKLPIKQLESLVTTSRKTIERNRKYIISLSIILDSNYLYLKDYLKIDDI